MGVICIAPIKALLNNQEERIGTYAEMVGLRRFVWHGDQKEQAKRNFVREPAEILTPTPESLEVMLVSHRSPVKRLFQALRLVVIDEVHALAGTDRGAHLISVIERLAPCSANVPDVTSAQAPGARLCDSFALQGSREGRGGATRLRSGSREAGCVRSRQPDASGERSRRWSPL